MAHHDRHLTSSVHHILYSTAVVSRQNPYTQASVLTSGSLEQGSWTRHRLVLYCIHYITVTVTVYHVSPECMIEQLL